jgi:hypothetical protein
MGEGISQEHNNWMLLHYLYEGNSQMNSSG